jgi:putative ABC transport system ATP-binding protein
MTIAAIENLGKTYRLGTREVSVLRGLDLSVQDGEYLAIMGPSGSGKSTLLNILGCLDRPTHGRYLLAGQDVSRLDDNQLSAIRGHRIGFVFQAYNLIAQLNVLENIEVPMYYGRVPAGPSAARARDLARMVGLGDRLTHRPFELSGGEQQRVAIARALTNDPVILLADEPTGNLDSQSGAEIMQILDQLHQRGRTLIIVTHDPQVAARTQRTIHLLDGRIEREENHYRAPLA